MSDEDTNSKRPMTTIGAVQDRVMAHSDGEEPITCYLDKGDGKREELLFMSAQSTAGGRAQIWWFELKGKPVPPPINWDRETVLAICKKYGELSSPDLMLQAIHKEVGAHEFSRLIHALTLMAVAKNSPA